MILVFLTGGLEPPRHVRHEARRPRGDPRRVQADRHERRRASGSASTCRGWRRSADKLAIVRSMSHRHTNHLNATHQVLTGHPQPGAFFDKIASRDDWPCYASALDYLRPRGRRRPQRRDAADLPDGGPAHLARPARRVPRAEARPLADQAGPEPAGLPRRRASACPSASASSGSSAAGPCSTSWAPSATQWSAHAERDPFADQQALAVLAAALRQGRPGLRDPGEDPTPSATATAGTCSASRCCWPAAGRGGRADRPGEHGAGPELGHPLGQLHDG